MAKSIPRIATFVISLLLFLELTPRLWYLTNISRAKELRKWLAKLGTRTLNIKPGSPWENGYCESFNGKLWNERLNGEIFYSLKEAQVVIKQWQVENNTRRPHSALGTTPPAARSPLVPPNPFPQSLAVM